MIYFDVETSGLDFVEDRIIELAMLVVDDGNVSLKYDKFIDIGRSLDSHIVELTGISDEVLSSEGVSEDVVFEDLRSILFGGSVLIAHNCQFDLNFLLELCSRHMGRGEVLDWFNNLYWLDSLTVFRDRKGYPHKLRDMVEYYGLDEVRFHRALDDVVALSRCVRALNKERGDVREYINVFGFNERYGVSGTCLDCIRYVPQPFSRGLVAKHLILPFR